MRTEPTIKNIPPSDFISRLVEINRMKIYGFERFVFFPGMMFNSKEKWWGDGGLRAVSHEGLDLCFFEGEGGAKFRLDETVQVPMVYDGVIVHMMDDFLGKTVVTRHGFGDFRYGDMLSLYGHVLPDPHLHVGDRIYQGDVFACLSGTAGRPTLLPPHLHISLAKAWMLPQVRVLTWKMLNQADRSVFIDPLTVLNADFAVVDYDRSVNVCDLYAKCSYVKSQADT